MARELEIASVSTLVHQFQLAESLAVPEGWDMNTNFWKVKAKFFTLFWL